MSPRLVLAFKRTRCVTLLSFHSSILDSQPDLIASCWLAPAILAPGVSANNMPFWHRGSVRWAPEKRLVMRNAMRRHLGASTIPLWITFNFIILYKKESVWFDDAWGCLHTSVSHICTTSEIHANCNDLMSFPWKSGHFLFCQCWHGEEPAKDWLKMNKTINSCHHPILTEYLIKVCKSCSTLKTHLRSGDCFLHHHRPR